MKTIRQIAVIAVVLLTSFSLSSQNAEVKDTTLFFNQKKIEISDSLEQVKVTVYKMDTTEYRRVYEGIFADDQTYETYSVESQMDFDFPFIKRNKNSKMRGNFSGSNFGIIYTHQGFTDFNDVNGMKTTFSQEFAFNPFGYTLPIVNQYFGLTTGLGMTWRNINLGNNTHLANIDGITVVESAPEGVNYSFSRLRIFDINFPVYLEYHPLGNNKFHIMGGLLIGVNTFSSHKVKYKDEFDKKITEIKGKDYNVNPFSVSCVLQVGWRYIAVYGKYTPTKLFKNSKGPDMQTFSVGLKI